MTRLPRGKAEFIGGVALVAALCLPTTMARAEADGIERGREYARAQCARCHSIERTGPSPVEAAPPFRTLHQRYPVEYLEESLAEGMITGHTDMPEVRLEPDQIVDFIDFLKSFEN